MAAVAAIAFGVATLRNQSYTAQSIVVVTSHPSSKGPGFATEAAKLATTYAGVLEQDPAVLDAIGTSVGRHRDEVRKRFSVINETDTAVLRLRYRDDNRQRATAGATTAATAIAGRRPVSRTIGAGSIDLVKLAGLPTKSNDATVVALAGGAILGLLLGVVLLLAWERADRRVDTVADAAATGLPTVLLDTMTPATAAALLERWGVMTAGRPARVALIPLSARLAPLAAEVRGRLQDAAVEVRRAQELKVVVAGLPGSGTAAEVEALRSDVNVLLAAFGSRERDLEAALAALEQFDMPAQWLLLTGSPRRLRKRLERDRAPRREAEEAGDEATAETVTR
jgi:capsular polysaccharide biosynthesis protein